MNRTAVLIFVSSLCIALLCIAPVCVSAERAETTNVSRRVDDLIEKQCTASGAMALGRCNDFEFLRRIWLDLAGRTPPLTDVHKLAGGAKLDREQIIRKLLKSPEFARYWGRTWTEYLTDQRPFETAEYDGRRLVQFLTESFAENRPYHEVVRDLMAGEGTSDVGGSVNFLLRYGAEPVPLTGAISQKFLGLSLQCAECHDHPHANWKMKDFWGLAAHFARLRKMTPTSPEDGESFFVVIERPRGELTVVDKRAKPNEAGEQPKKTVYPQLPGMSRTDAAKQRRTVLVEWLIEPSNPYLSRHLVNLLWNRLVGDKLIQNFDHWPPVESTTESELLNLMADEFAAEGWDIQRLIQTIVLTDAYQRSSHTEEPINSQAAVQKSEDLSRWTHARIRPLSADQLHLSIGQAFGYHHDENDFRLAESTGEEFTQDIPVGNLGSTSLTLGRALALYNSDYIRGAVDLGVETAIRLYGPAAGAEHIDRFFMLLLSRRPTTEELEFFQDLGGEEDPRQGLQDVVWVLLNSTEFVTNH